ncbi:MAG: carboxypeptidase regulatory-like domain-containing protein [Bacteroidetes bacterium]|nr:carboxypeptidase regulatory-like domain-containing protein [Bacteroidota bacterium]
MKKLVLILTVSLSAILFSEGFASNPELFLISERGIEKSKADISDLWFFDNSESVIRYSEVSLSNEVVSYNYSNKDSNLLHLNLFEDITYEAKIDYTSTYVNGSKVVRARINNYEWASMILSTTENRSLAVVNIPSKDLHYKIISCPETNKHYILELNISKLDYIEGDDDVLPPAPDEKAIQEQIRIQNEISAKNLGPLDHATVDVLIVYTTAAKSWGNSSGGGVDNIVSLAVAQSNLSYDNSETFMAMRLVHATETYYVESGSSSNDLSNLTNGTGALGMVHEWRNEFGADLVAMFSDVSDTGGIAWLLTSTNGRPDMAFSITRVRQATGLTHAHETGHNMGCHHHKAQNFQAGPGLFNYSAGWRWTGTNNAYYCDLMTYSSGSYFQDGVTHTNVAYFSNPYVSHQNVPTGDVSDGDNARTLREIKHVISAYRAAIVNSVEGIVTDIDDNPLAGAQIRVAGTSIITYSGADGTFVFSALTAGERTLIASLEGYTTQHQLINVYDNETTNVVFKLSVLSVVEVSGIVYGADDEETGLEGAIVALVGDSYFETKTNELGEYLFDEVFGESLYSLHVYKPGYELFIDNISIPSGDYLVDDVVLDYALYDVDNVTSKLQSGNTLISWDEPTGKKVFRYDNGTPVSNIGFFGGTLKGVLGAAHFSRGYVDAISWMLTGANHSTVSVWIMGINDMNLPDRTNIIYHAENVPNTHMQWTVHELSEPVYAANGFFIGLSAAGSLGLAVDGGIDDLYGFQDGTQFYNSDYTQYDFRDMNTWVPRNFLIRALAFDLGSLNSGKSISAASIEEEEFKGVSLKSYEYPAVLTGYNVYLTDMTTPVASNVANTEYLFTGLGSGVYTVGIQAVYEQGLSDIVMLTFPPYTPVEDIVTSDIKLYPNPAKDIINITAATIIKEIEVYNLLGTLIEREKVESNEVQLNLNNYKSGFYFINVITEYGKTTHKIVVTK